MTRFASALVVVAALSLPAPRAAQAQLGGLIKKKVTEAVKGPEKKPDEKPNADPSSIFGGDVLEITQPVFAGLLRGLETELRLQGEFKAELAKYPTFEQYNECLKKVAMDPEYMKIIERMGQGVPANATPDQAAAAQKKMSSELEALADKHCPVKSVDVVWPNGKRMERLAQIHEKAAASAGEGSSPWNVRQYELVLERTGRLCAYNNDPTGGSTTDGNLMIQGAGPKMFWVFTKTETDVVNAANCAKLKALTDRLL